MAPTERSENLHVRLSKDESDALQALADAEGMNASDMVRQLVRRAVQAKYPNKTFNLVVGEYRDAQRKKRAK